MDLLTYLRENGVSMAAFAVEVDTTQSTISRIANRVVVPLPPLAVKIVVATEGRVTMDEIYGTPKRWWAKGSSK